MSLSGASSLFAPAMALSARLGPWGRALLVGALLCALAAPGGLLAWQWRAQMKAVGLERQGLKALVAQEQAFAALAAPAAPGADAAVEALLRRAQADGLALQAERLDRAWKALSAEVPDSPRQAAAQAAALDALGALMRESARVHGLFLDARLDAAADLLATQLPRLLQALGRPQDTPAEAAEPRLLLAAMQPGLQAGLAQLGTLGAAAPRQQLEQLHQALARPEPAVDAAPAQAADAIPAAQAAVPQARALFEATVTAADGVLAARHAQLRQRLLLLAGALAGTWVLTAYLLLGFQLRTRRSLRRLIQYATVLRVQPDFMPTPLEPRGEMASLVHAIAALAQGDARQPAWPAANTQPAHGPEPVNAAAVAATAAAPSLEVAPVAVPDTGPAPTAPADVPGKLTLHPPPMDSDALQRARVLQQALQSPDALAAKAAAPRPMPVHDLPAAMLPGKRLLLDLRLFLRDDEVLRVCKAVGKALAPQPDLAADARLCVEALLTHLIRQQLPGMPEASAQLLLSLGGAGLEVMLRDDAPPAELLLDPLDRDLDVVRATMDEVLSFHDGRGNLIVLTKALPAGQPVAEGA
ncbi:hypothetical protein [Azohydromonas aeria]|uniref:hypothetical protein n=1 Tax=Azohydromonas aeria TaxID=2590212 RepID=UPI0012F94996|nr:hypothetical protein [Azohydromonas aeria]